MSFFFIQKRVNPRYISIDKTFHNNNFRVTFKARRNSPSLPRNIQERVWHRGVMAHKEITIVLSLFRSRWLALVLILAIDIRFFCIGTRGQDLKRTEMIQLFRPSLLAND